MCRNFFSHVLVWALLHTHLDDALFFLINLFHRQGQRSAEPFFVSDVHSAWSFVNEQTGIEGLFRKSQIIISEPIGRF